MRCWDSMISSCRFCRVSMMGTVRNRSSTQSLINVSPHPSAPSVADSYTGDALVNLRESVLHHRVRHATIATKPAAELATDHRAKALAALDRSVIPFDATWACADVASSIDTFSSSPSLLSFSKATTDSPSNSPPGFAYVALYTYSTPC